MEKSSNNNPIRCPKCGLINPEKAGRCDCGYNFLTCSRNEPNPRSADIPLYEGTQRYSQLKPWKFRWLRRHEQIAYGACAALVFIGPASIVLFALFEDSMRFLYPSHNGWFALFCSGLVTSILAFPGILLAHHLRGFEYAIGEKNRRIFSMIALIFGYLSLPGGVIFSIIAFMGAPY